MMQVKCDSANIRHSIRVPHFYSDFSTDDPTNVGGFWSCRQLAGCRYADSKRCSHRILR